MQLTMLGSCAILGYLTRDEGMSKSKYMSKHYMEPMPLVVVVWVNNAKNKEHRTRSNQLCNVRASSPQDHVLEALHGHTTKCHANETYDILYWSAFKSNANRI